MGTEVSLGASRKASDVIGLSPVSIETLSNQVADKIVDAIAQGRLAPGQRLIETDLAAALQVSRVPVREALALLESQGVVVSAPRRGLQVGDFDEVWARQLRRARSALECQAAMLAATRIAAEPSLITKLDERIEALSAARNNRLAVNKADINFHATIFDLAGSPLLWTLWRAIARHVLILFSIEFNRNPDFEEVMADHQRYRDMLVVGDMKDFITEITRHMAGHEARKEPENNHAKGEDK